MSQSSHISCPNCEFAGAPAGRVVPLAGGVMRCRACGGSFRLVGQVAPVLPPAGLQPVMAEANRILGGRHRAAGHEWRVSAAPVLRAVAAILAFTALLVSAQAVFVGDTGSLKGRETQGLAITAYSARQFARDGRHAVRVEGRITNQSGRRLALGMVEIAVSQASGTIVYSWKYRPALSHLEPGQAIRFSTAEGNVPQAGERVEIRAGGVLVLAGLKG